MSSCSFEWLYRIRIQPIVLDEDDPKMKTLEDNLLFVGNIIETTYFFVIILI